MIYCLSEDFIISLLVISSHQFSLKSEWLQISSDLFRPVIGEWGVVEYTDYISAERWDPTFNKCPGYGTKLSDGWGKQSIPSLQLLPSPLGTRVVSLDRVLSMGQIELFAIQTMSKQMTYAKLNF